MGTTRARRGWLPLAFLLAVLPACGDQDVVGLHLRLGADGKGVLTTRSLLPSETAGPAEGRVEGVSFQGRANLHCSQGTFSNITDVRIGGIRFGGWRPTDDSPSLTVYVPLGEDADWARMLAPAVADQDKATKVFDPTGATNGLGRTVKLEVELPGDVVSFGTFPRTRGVQEEKDGRLVQLWIPVDRALTKGQSDLRWDFSWQPPAK